MNHKGAIKQLEKRECDPITYWAMIEANEKLINLAIKLIKLPLSSASVEKLFSQWSFVHSKLHNRFRIIN